jgi:hypothetical protein
MILDFSGVYVGNNGYPGSGLLYTLSTNLHSKTVKKNVLAYPIKIAKKKILFITRFSKLSPC